MLAAILTNLTAAVSGFTWNCVAADVPAFAEVAVVDVSWTEESEQVGYTTCSTIPS